MPDAAGNFRGMAVPADAWERIFGGFDPADHGCCECCCPGPPDPHCCGHDEDRPDDGA